MNARKLDIIVPHGGEPWETCRSFFDMLRLQLVADFSKVRVIVVHDNCEDWPDNLLFGLPVEVEQLRVFKRNGAIGTDKDSDPRDCERAGVSTARNTGLEKSDAEWVMFCDCDDRFATVWAMHSILDALNQESSTHYDLLWTKFYVEQDLGRSVTGLNWVFIHGKIWRREFLVRENIRFNPDLYYAEDSAFCATADMAIEQGHVGEIQTDAVPYVWVWNRESVTSRPENKLRNVLGLYDRHVVVAEEYRKRGQPENAAAMAARAVWDGYYQCHRDDLNEEQLRQVEEKVARYYMRYKEEIDHVPEDVLRKIMDASRKEAIGKRFPDVPADGYPAWIRKIDEKYGG